MQGLLLYPATAPLLVLYPSKTAQVQCCYSMSRCDVSNHDSTQSNGGVFVQYLGSRTTHL